jgi:hypothetical protein
LNVNHQRRSLNALKENATNAMVGFVTGLVAVKDLAYEKVIDAKHSVMETTQIWWNYYNSPDYYNN